MIERPTCATENCNAPAVVIECDYLYSCAKCWNTRNIPPGWKLPKQQKK